MSRTNITLFPNVQQTLTTTMTSTDTPNTFWTSIETMSTTAKGPAASGVDTKSPTMSSMHTNMRLLEEMELKVFLSEDIPIMVYMGILFFIGLFGNSQAIIVYSRRYKSSIYRTFVLALAIVDFIATALAIPFEMFDIRYSMTFSVFAICKFFKLVNYFTGTCSGFLLGIIVVERFRKVCKPLAQQITVTQSKWACFITLTTALVFASPSLVIYGSLHRPVEGTHLVSTECTVLTEHKQLFKIHSIVVLVLSTAVFILCIVLYTMVGRALYRQKEFRRKFTEHGSRSSSHSNSSNGKNNIIQESPSCNEDSSLTEGDNSSSLRGTRRFDISGASNFPKPRKKDLSRRVRKITIIFLVATAVSYLGYLPNMVLLILKATAKEHYLVLESSHRALTHILVRSYFLSNCTNPIVYCFLDKKFRKELKRMYLNIFSCCKRSRSRVV